MSKKHPLAYARVIDKIYLPEEYDKRKKLTAGDKRKIRFIYKTKKTPYRVLAGMFGVSFGAIQIIINEDTRRKNLIRSQEWRKRTGYKKKPYDSMDIRRRKKDLILKNIIKLLASVGSLSLL